MTRNGDPRVRHARFHAGLLLVVIGTTACASSSVPLAFALSLIAGGTVLVMAVLRPFMSVLFTTVAVTAVPHGMAADLVLRSRVGGFPLHPVEALFAATMLGLAIQILLAALRRTREDATHPPVDIKRLARSSLVLPLVALATVAVLGAVVGILRDNRLWDIGRDLRNLSYYLFFAAAYLTIDSNERVTKIVRWIVLGNAAFSVLCIAAALSPEHYPIHSESLEYWRGASRFYFHNHFVSLLTIPFLAAFIVRADAPRKRALAASLLVVVIAAVFLSQTRTLVVASIVGCFAAGITACFRLNHNGKRAAVRRFALVLPLVVASGFFVAQAPHVIRAALDMGLSSRFEALADGSDSSLRGRIIANRLAIHDIAEHPIIGHGAGALMQVPWAHEGHHDVSTEGRLPAVDSSPVAITFKFGLLGLIVSTWLIVSLLRCQWRAVHRPNALSYSITTALLWGTLALCAISVFQSFFLTSRLILFFAVIAALSDWAGHPDQGPARSS